MKGGIIFFSKNIHVIDYKTFRTVISLNSYLFSQTLMNAKITLVRMEALALILPPEATRVTALRASKEKDPRRVRFFKKIQDWILKSKYGFCVLY